MRQTTLIADLEERRASILRRGRRLEYFTIAYNSLEGLISVMLGLMAGNIALRESSGNSDSVLSGSLASPKPPRGGDTKERGNETHETQSRSNL